MVSKDSSDVRPRAGPKSLGMNGHQSVPKSEHQANESPVEARIPVKTIKLITYHELPDWLKDNDYIWSRYRPPLYSIATCIKSCFMLHTETGNIWSHVLGFLLFVVLAVQLYFFSGHPLKLQDKVLFGIYFISVWSCLGFSSTYHCFSCHSKECARLCRKYV